METFRAVVDGALPVLLPPAADFEAAQEDQLRALSHAGFLQLTRSVLGATRSCLSHAGTVSQAVQGVPGETCVAAFAGPVLADLLELLMRQSWVRDAAS